MLKELVTKSGWQLILLVSVIGLILNVGVFASVLYLLYTSTLPAAWVLALILVVAVVQAMLSYLMYHYLYTENEDATGGLVEHALRLGLISVFATVLFFGYLLFANPSGQRLQLVVGLYLVIWLAIKIASHTVEQRLRALGAMGRHARH